MESDSQDSNTGRAASTSAKNWLASLALDAAKLGLVLYLLGLIVSSFYYSRFSILTLDFTKTQSILIGVYIVVLYAVLPAAILFAIKWMTSARMILLMFSSAIGLVDLEIGLMLQYRKVGLLLAVVLTAILQFSLFASFPSSWSLVRGGQAQMKFVLIPSRAKAGVFALLFCLHFSMVWFPRIPAYFGGGTPLRVQVFTRIADLPANRFVMSKNYPQINKSLDSYALLLLYETDKDVYFLYDLQTGDTLIGYSVMRLKKDEILRIDYMTPKWVRWEGGK
jgi:hypothetical protein